mgnify:CR=1 FL=1
MPRNVKNRQKQKVVIDQSALKYAPVVHFPSPEKAPY